MAKHFPLIAVGGGPAGIAAAIEYIEMGGKACDALVLEKGAVPIEAIRRFYPEKKMTIANYKGLATETKGHIPTFPDLTKAQTIVYFDDLIQKYGLSLRLKSEVFKILKDDQVFRVLVGQEEVTADFVFIGIGILGRPNKPAYKLPNTLRDQILYDLTSQKVEKLKVLVVGGGDTSSEYCQVLVEVGNEVTLAYRGDKFERMMDQNRLAAERLQASGRLRILRSCEIKEVADDTGKPKVVFADEAKFPAETFDKIVYSIGGTTPINFLKTCGIECEATWPKVGPSGETNIPGLYLIGDLAVGRQGGSIITAYNSAFRTISHMNLLRLKS